MARSRTSDCLGLAAGNLDGKEVSYTRQERQLYTNPVAALAAAVIRQWKLDGSPAACKETINLWQKIYDEAISLKQNNP